MRTPSLLLLAVGLSCGIGAPDALAARPGTPGGTGSDKTPDLERVAKLLLESTNAFRKEQGRGELKNEEKLASTARDFARFLAENDKFGHEADGSNPSERVKKHGYDYCALAENIAYEFNTEGFASEELARNLVENWKNSPGHRKNMLDPDATESGMAVAHSEKSDKYYAVQVFGRPRSAAFSFQVANESGEKFDYKMDGEAYSLEPQYTRTHEVCRPGQLEFPWAEAVGKAETFTPAKDDRFVVGKKDGKLIVIRKAAEKKDAPTPAAEGTKAEAEGPTP
ncbi:Cysteine-rich secretory protein family protein [Aquisphaera giovannonii]|uniref:Cysteine-rich secretory protein family protein n=1 Tax=Aquisphaera giovannonii TaxID=406548 RepID=A0A5B9WA98_9BACT|nr:CAP domain-containing protein [Aquisphaera giovannonii]QEH37456.1 Cysteine-rich secretory protein family protein [Aquisphaera giovannonii]